MDETTLKLGDKRYASVKAEIADVYQLNGWSWNFATDYRTLASAGILAVDTGNGIANAYAAWYIMEINRALSTDTQANIEARWTIPI